MRKLPCAGPSGASKAVRLAVFGLAGSARLGPECLPAARLQPTVACYGLGQPLQYEPRVAQLVAPSQMDPRFRYRRMAWLLRWSQTRVQRLWSQQVLKLPRRFDCNRLAETKRKKASLQARRLLRRHHRGMAGRL